VSVHPGARSSRVGRTAPWVALAAILGAWFLSMSAFGVLAGAITAAIIGAIVFLPHILPTE